MPTSTHTQNQFWCDLLGLQLWKTRVTWIALNTCRMSSIITSLATFFLPFFNTLLRSSFSMPIFQCRVTGRPQIYIVSFNDLDPKVARKLMTKKQLKIVSKSFWASTERNPGSVWVFQYKSYSYNPWKQWDKLPTSAGDRWISAINNAAFLW